MDDIGDLNTELEPWQVEEIDKCRESFEYFASNYVHITHPKRGLVKFNMYDYQKRMVADYEKYTYNIISKFRQGGATTTTVLWCMWRCLFMCDQKILVVSIGDREAVGAGKTVKVALENLPDWMKPQMGKNNDHEKEFHDTNSSIIFASPKAVRSMSLTLLVIDEAAFISNMDDLWAAMMPTLSTGGSCVVISTVNGIGNWYEEMYHGAVGQERVSLHRHRLHRTPGLLSPGLRQADAGQPGRAEVAGRVRAELLRVRLDLHRDLPPRRTGAAGAVR
jgi:hypothetical protein